MYHNSLSSLCNQQLLRVLEFYSPVHQFCLFPHGQQHVLWSKLWLPLCHTIFIANSGPLHLKTAFVFFSFAVVTAFGRPFLFGHTVPQAYVEWKVPHKILDLYKIVHIHAMPFVQKVNWIHKPHNKFCCCCCIAWIQNFCSLCSSCPVFLV